MERARLKDLAILSELRGTHSAGVLCMYEKNKERLVAQDKDAVTTSQFLSSGNGENIFAHSDMFLIAGHSRHATVGTINKENAHPFRAGDIFGMHNGTVPTMGSSTKTDSQELFETLNSLDRSEWPEFFRAVDKVGAFALVFIDIKTNKLYIVRNKDRTLYYVEHLGVRYFCSEWLMFDFWKKRLSLTTSTVSWFEPMRLYSWDLNDFRKRTEVDLAPKKEDPPWEYKPQVIGPPSVPLISHKVDEENMEYMAFKGKTMSVQKARGLLQYGCAVCDKVSSIKDTTWWFNNESHLCSGCKDHNLFVKEYFNRNSHTTLYRSKVVDKKEPNNVVVCN